jgi:hypothetical protein
MLLVRKVVPTLTSNSAEIYPSMASAKQLVTLVFILVPAGAVCQAVVCSGHYIASHRGACRGVLQARRERRLVLQVPEVLIEESANIGVRGQRRESAVHLCCLPLRLGDCPSFYRLRIEQFTGVPHNSSMCEGMASSAAELTVVLANLTPAGASWRVLCSYRSSFEGGSAVVDCTAVVRGPTRGWRQREAVRGTVAGVATSCPRALQQRQGCRHSARRGIAVVGMAAQG